MALTQSQYAMHFCGPIERYFSRHDGCSTNLMLSYLPLEESVHPSHGECGEVWCGTCHNRELVCGLEVEDAGSWINEIFCWNMFS